MSWVPSPHFTIWLFEFTFKWLKNIGVGLPGWLSAVWEYHWAIKKLLQVAGLLKPGFRVGTDDCENSTHSDLTFQSHSFLTLSLHHQERAEVKLLGAPHPSPTSRFPPLPWELYSPDALPRPALPAPTFCWDPTVSNRRCCPSLEDLSVLLCFPF